MNSNDENKKQNDKDTLLKIKTLEAKYETILHKYEEAYQTYLQYLNSVSGSGSGSGSDATYVQLPGRAFWGEKGIRETSATSADDCEDMCASTADCTGATFNSNKNYCWLRSGNAGSGNIVAGTDADVAVLPKIRQLLLECKHYNQELVGINNQLSDFYATLPPPTEENDTTQKQEMLLQFNAQLEEEQHTIEMEKNILDDIEASKNTQDIVATQGYTLLRFWLLLAIFMIIVAVKIFMGVALTILIPVSLLIVFFMSLVF